MRRRGGKVSVRAKPCHVASVFDEKKEVGEEARPASGATVGGKKLAPALPSAEDLATMRAAFLGATEATSAKPLEGAALLKHLAAVGREEAAAGTFALAPSELTDATRVPGCAARVWVDVDVSADPSAGSLLHFRGHSDSAVTSGLCALLCRHLSGKYSATDFLAMDASFVKDLGLAAALSGGAATNHRFGLFAIFDGMKKRVSANLLGRGEPFPSLVVSHESLVPKGSYAEAQAKYLRPDEATVEQLADLLRTTQTGVVAHFYMDPEVQGVLARAKNSRLEHIHIR